MWIVIILRKFKIDFFLRVNIGSNIPNEFSKDCHKMWTRDCRILFLMSSCKKTPTCRERRLLGTL